MTGRGKPLGSKILQAGAWWLWFCALALLAASWGLAILAAAIADEEQEQEANSVRTGL